MQQEEIKKALEELQKAIEHTGGAASYFPFHEEKRLDDIAERLVTLQVGLQRIQKEIQNLDICKQK